MPGLFAFKNYNGKPTIEIQEDTVCADTIIPPQGLMIGEYNVSYDLISGVSELRLLETLSATVTISKWQQAPEVSSSTSEVDRSDNEDT